MPKKKKNTDAHTSGLLIRFPEWCREALEKLKAKNRRPFTVEMLIAFEKHCRDEGVKIPEPVA